MIESPNGKMRQGLEAQGDHSFEALLVSDALLDWPSLVMASVVSLDAAEEGDEAELDAVLELVSPVVTIPVVSPDPVGLGLTGAGGTTLGVVTVPLGLTEGADVGVPVVGLGGCEVELVPEASVVEGVPSSAL